MTTVYLAGPIAGRTYRQATEWRIEATGKLPFEVFDPMRGKSNPGDDRPITPDQLMGMSAEEVFDRDMDDVFEADIMLANMEGFAGSVGTPFEWGVAYARRQHLVVYNLPANIAGHPFVRGNPYITVLTTLDEATDEVKRLSRLLPSKVRPSN